MDASHVESFSTASTKRGNFRSETLSHSTAFVFVNKRIEQYITHQGNLPSPLNFTESEPLTESSDSKRGPVVSRVSCELNLAPRSTSSERVRHALSPVLKTKILATTHLTNRLDLNLQRKVNIRHAIQQIWREERKLGLLRRARH